MNKIVLTRKYPRHFVFVDDYWEADDAWDEYFLKQSVWVYMDEYRAELPGDEDYSQITIQSCDESGWKYSRELKDREIVHSVLASIKKPVSEQNLRELGFEKWQGTAA